MQGVSKGKKKGFVHSLVVQRNQRIDFFPLYRWFANEDYVIGQKSWLPSGLFKGQIIQIWPSWMMMKIVYFKACFFRNLSKSCNILWNSNSESSYFNKFLKTFFHFWGFDLFWKCVWPNWTWQPCQKYVINYSYDHDLPLISLRTLLWSFLRQERT